MLDVFMKPCNYITLSNYGEITWLLLLSVWHIYGIWQKSVICHFKWVSYVSASTMFWWSKHDLHTTINLHDKMAMRPIMIYIVITLVLVQCCSPKNLGQLMFNEPCNLLSQNAIFPHELWVACFIYLAWSVYWKQKSKALILNSINYASE